MWKCSHCYELFYDGDICADHLGERHGILQLTRESEEVEAIHIGRCANFNFWCGFCKTLIKQDEIEKGSGLAPYKRLDHIDHHIVKKKVMKD